MGDFTRFRAVIHNSLNSSVRSSSAEASALPVSESPINAPSFVLSSLASDSVLYEETQPIAASPKVPKHRHKLTKARAASLSISLKGTKVNLPLTSEAPLNMR